MKSFLFLAFIALCLSFPSCKPAGTDVAVVEETKTNTVTNEWAKMFLDSANQVFSQQLKTGDSVGLTAQYWPDAELLFSHMETIEGKDILANWGTMIRSGLTDISFTTTDVVNTNEYIIETGKYELKDAKGTMADKGNFVVVWQNRDGIWKLYRDTGITTMPAGH